MPAAMETWRETRRKLKVEKARDEAKKQIVEAEDEAHAARIPKVVDTDVG
jgi:vacuolar-type H+-ATPase subunit H